MNYYKEVKLIVYENVDEVSRIEYKGRVIQTYVYDDGEQSCLCHFVMKEDGNDDEEFFCLLKAIKYIDKVTK